MGSLETAYNTLIENAVASKKHKYLELDLPQSVMERDLKLPRDAYKANYAKVPRDISKVTSLIQKTEWKNGQN